MPRKKITTVYNTKFARNLKNLEIIFFHKIKTQSIDTCPKLS
jgi:hypothetical protein